jgi:DNA-binding Lrp family transcriptional regulator
MELDETQRRILEVVDKQGPVSNETIADELQLSADRLEVADVRGLTAELQRRAFLEQSENAPDRWQLTDDGRVALGL